MLVRVIGTGNDPVYGIWNSIFSTENKGVINIPRITRAVLLRN
jgi:hypothetical protein